MSNNARTILVAGGYAPSLVNFRAPFLKALRAARHKVVATAAEDDVNVSATLAEMGITYQCVPLKRAGVSPVADLRYLDGLQRLMERERPDLILAYTHKPVVYTALAAARLAQRPRVYPLITGLGFAFTSRGPKPWLARQVLKLLYRRASRHFSGVFFQNPDDQALFKQLGLVRPGTPQCIIRGSGVDVSAFSYLPLVNKDQPSLTRFLLIARLLGDKGIREYISAARLIKAEHPRVEFHLVGPVDSNPAAIPQSEVETWQQAGVIIYHGPQSDVRPYLRDCTAYVLPSYREGTPRTVLEAMATGRAVITTDAPGCRETIFGAKLAGPDGVSEGKNGFLVPVGSIDPLAAAMRRFWDDPTLALRMGVEGRRLAEQHYDVVKVNRQMLQFMNLCPRSQPGESTLAALGDIINQVRENKGQPPLGELHPGSRLREEIGFESLDLAEFTVRIEEKFGVDVFADGLVHTVGEIQDRISRAAH
ncbi:MAG: glycosyltransferase [Opitutaceae bacterium]|nr:glycosyltransferase [Opitutaceae bacterium]